MQNLKSSLYKNLIQSPLNYMGGKFRLLPQILPLFAPKISTGVDLFCGGANVGINLNAQKIILNDKQSEIIAIFKYFKKHEIAEIFTQIQNIIVKFQLSNSCDFGYKFYGCDSAKGLSGFNKTKFLALRESYNQDKNILKLFVLIIFAFNNQIRFNAKNEFNLPCKKRDFNAKMQEKLRRFIHALKSKNIGLQSVDFREFDLKILDKNDFIYIDPPYLLGTASYNENGAWGQDDEKDLLEFIEKIHANGVKFALSNVIFHKNKEHKILKKWLEKNKNFNSHLLQFSYKNCNYQAKNSHSQEILVTNFKERK